MTTLVIHPDGDKTTEVLSQIYKNKGYTVFREQNPTKQLLEQIKSHDRIIMLGHGSPTGLFNSQFDHIIWSNQVYLLKSKICVGIWCHASDFAMKYDLKGFFTSMFISEVSESYHYQIWETQENITISNELFASNMAKLIDLPVDSMFSSISEAYSIENSELVRFNKEGFRCFS